MGREATCICRWDGGEGEVRAILEARQIVVRGSVTLKLPIDNLSRVHVIGGHLLLAAPGCTFELHLGKAEAANWARRIAPPPPTSELVIENETLQEAAFGEISSFAGQRK